ncbi:MAG: flagellin, partial [Thaumarchaeota archaeon]|nr:flagellin [Nitrososphaerota archaeon]
AVNLNPALTSIKYYSNTVRYDNIYASNCLLKSKTYTNATTAFADAVTATCISANPAGSSAAAPSSTEAIVYWDVSGGSTLNGILNEGQHADIAIAYKSADRPGALDNVKAEVIVPTGSALTVERQVPSVTTTVVDLG